MKLPVTNPSLQQGNTEEERGERMYMKEGGRESCEMVSSGQDRADAQVNAHQLRVPAQAPYKTKPLDSPVWVERSSWSPTLSTGDIAIGWLVRDRESLCLQILMLVACPPDVSIPIFQRPLIWLHELSMILIEKSVWSLPWDTLVGLRGS